MKVINDKALLVQTYNVDEVTSSISRSADTDDGVAVYWGLKESEKLAELGFKDTPSPLLRDYEWTSKLKPF